jgi:hypothetical protein
MPRDGAITLRDIVGKLDKINIECDKCAHRGRAGTIPPFLFRLGPTRRS